MKKRIAFFLTLIFCMNLMAQPAFADVLEQGLPDVDAKAYVVMDESKNEIILIKNSTVEMDMSNFSQVMTALLILEKGTLTDNVTIGTIPEEYGNKLMLRSGEKVLLENLLKGIVVYSATDAAVAGAEHISGNTTKFVKLMNSKAKDLGMTHTNFTNVFGGSEDGQKTTAQDMVKLASYVAKNEKYMELAALESIQWQGDVRSNSMLENTNKLSKTFSSAKGIKMGDNRSGDYALMATMEKDGRVITAVMLGCSAENSMYSDMKTLLNFALNNTKVVPVIQKDSVMTVLNYGEDKSVRVAAGEDYALLMAKSNSAVTGYNIVLDNVELKIKKGERIGNLEILVDGAVVDKVPLVALDEAKKPINFFGFIVTFLAALYLVQIGLRTYRMVKKEQRKKANTEQQ